jgi:hypothetical protein
MGTKRTVWISLLDMYADLTRGDEVLLLPCKAGGASNVREIRWREVHPSASEKTPSFCWRPNAAITLLPPTYDLHGHLFPL